MDVLDIVLLAFLAVCALIGAFQGLVRILYRFASLVASFLIFLFAAPPLAAWVSPWTVFDDPRAEIARFLLARAGASGATTAAEAVETLGLPEPLQAVLLAQVPDPGAALQAFADALAARIFLFALTAAVGLALLVVVGIVLWLLTAAIEAGLKKAKALDGVNHAVGGLLGLAEGVVTVFLALAMLALAAPWIPEAVEAIGKTTLVDFAYRVNPLLLLL